MSWNMLASAAERKASEVTFRLQVTKGGRGRFWFSLPSAVAAGLGFEAFDKAHVYFGADEHEGQVWVRPCADGAHGISRMAYAVRVVADVPPGTALKENVASLTYDKAPESEGFMFSLPGWAKAGFDPRDGKHYDKPDAAGKPASLEMNGNDLIMGGKQVALTKSQAVIMSLLIENFGRCVRTSTIMDALYQADPNGGANEKILQVFIHKIRAILDEKKFALAIVTHKSQGVELRNPIA